MPQHGAGCRDQPDGDPTMLSSIEHDTALVDRRPHTAYLRRLMEIDVVGDPCFFARSGPYSLAEVTCAAGGTATDADLVFNGGGPTAICWCATSQLPARPPLRGSAGCHAGRGSTGSAGFGSASAEYCGGHSCGGHLRSVGQSCRFVSSHIRGATRHTSTGTSVPHSNDRSLCRGWPFCTIGAGASIGPGCRIDLMSASAGVRMGKDCRIGAHTSISHALLGDRVCLHPGVRLGQEGFSFAHTSNGFLTVPQLGRVLIEDDVEIGANSTVDRGSVRDTVIGAGSRIDNLVQIGHNVRLGKCCVIVAQVGISGSTVLEDFVQVGGQAAFTGHVTIGRGAQVGAQAGVISDIAPGAIVLGSPAQLRQDFFRQVATLKRLAKRAPAPPSSLA